MEERAPKEVLRSVQTSCAHLRLPGRPQCGSAKRINGIWHMVKRECQFASELHTQVPIEILTSLPQSSPQLCEKE